MGRFSSEKSDLPKPSPILPPCKTELRPGRDSNRRTLPWRGTGLTTPPPGVREGAELGATASQSVRAR